MGAFVDSAPAMTALIIFLGFIPLITGSPYAYIYRGSYSPYSSYYSSYSPYLRGYGNTNRFRIKPFTAFRTNDFSTDIIQQTRSLSDSVQSTLRSLAADPESAVIVAKIIRDKDNVCINTLEEGLAGIEAATKLVENAGDDIKTLISKVNSFTKLKEPAIVVKEVAAILRILEPLVKNIAPSFPEICQATPDEAFGSLRSLAVLVDSLASTHRLQLSAEGRAELKQSGATISAVTTFLTQLRAAFSRFEDVCTKDKQYNLEAISAVGDLMTHLADMFGSLGGVKTGESIRKGKLYTDRVVAELNKIGSLDIGTLDCDRPGDFSVAAHTLEDLATIIEDVGVEALQEQLGINLSFVFY